MDVHVDRSRQEVSTAGVDRAFAGDGIETPIDRDDPPLTHPYVTNASVRQLRAGDEHGVAVGGEGINRTGSRRVSWETSSSLRYGFESSAGNPG
ncbi:hypothetical protein JCM18237_06560 [Halorubrum luteum]